MKKLLLILLILTLSLSIIFSLSSCGDDDSSSGSLTNNGNNNSGNNNSGGNNNGGNNSGNNNSGGNNSLQGHYIPNGTYKSESGIKIEVYGNKMIVNGVTYKYYVNGNVLTIEIVELDDEVKAQLEAAGMDVDEYIDAMKAQLEPMEYEKTADGFKLEGVEYARVDSGNNNSGNNNSGGNDSESSASPSFSTIYTSDSSDLVSPLTSYKDFFNNGGIYNSTVERSSGDYAVFKKTAVVNNYNGYTDSTVYYEYWNVVTETKLADFSVYSGSNTSYSFSIYDGLLSVCQATFSTYNYEYSYSYSLYNANGSTVYSYESEEADIDYVGNDLYVVRKNGAESFDLYKEGQYVTTYYIPSSLNFSEYDYYFTANYAIAIEDTYAVYYDTNFNLVATYYFPQGALNSPYFGSEPYALSDGRIVFIGYETRPANDQKCDFTYNGYGYVCRFEIYDPVENDTYDIDYKYPIIDVDEVYKLDYHYAQGVELLVEYYNVKDGVVDASNKCYACMDYNGEHIYNLSSFVEDQTDRVEPLGNGYYIVSVVGGCRILDANGNAVGFVPGFDDIIAYDFGFLYEDDGVYTLYDKQFNVITSIDTASGYEIGRAHV